MRKENFEAKYGAIFMSLFMLGAMAEANEVVLINNQLAQCAEFRNAKVLNDKVVPILSVELKLKDSIADCGCKSALGTFSVSAQRDGYTSYLIGGKVALSKDGEKIIPVAADHNLVTSAVLEISFSCAQPD